MARHTLLLQHFATAGRRNAAAGLPLRRRAKHPKKKFLKKSKKFFAPR